MRQSSSKRKAKSKAKGQPYDSSLKQWVKENPGGIIPELLQGVTFQEALDIEIIKPPMRADRVFKVLYEGETSILDIEFETGSDGKMRERLLVYNSVLYMQYTIPVISLIVYPFRTTMACSPLHLQRDKKDLLLFHFLTFPLFELHAEHFLREHVTCMYPLLPTMQGTNA